MAKIVRTLSRRVNTNGTAEIYLRVTLARNVQLRVRSEIFIKPQRFKDGEVIKPRANQKEIAVLHELETDLKNLEAEIVSFCIEHKPTDITKEMLEEVVDRHHHPEKYDITEETEKLSFFHVWEDFLKNRDLSKNREDIYRSLARALHRYEIHRQQTRDADFTIELDTFSAEDIMDFEQFYRDEWKIYDEYPQIYIDYPAEMRLQRKTHKPSRRGDNIVVNTMKRIRAFYNWCYAQGLTDNRPFDRYQGVKSERYGTPYYLTKDERDRIADFDLSSRPKLAIQRDIFIFQCLIGCRVSDLIRLQKSNVVGDMIEYVAQKTKKDRSDVVRVPLNPRAKALVARYHDIESNALFPFISAQRYNDAIKDICRLCGIDRVVTIINPTTGEDERKPIYEIASSHLARRTFIGNLYKQVKDPNLVSSMSGHKEGSKAFARYRDIDDDIKRDLIGLLD